MTHLSPSTIRMSACLAFVAATSLFGQSSPEALIGGVLSGLEAKDAVALKALAITPDDAKKYVWPSAAPNMTSGGMNADKFAGIYVRSSETGLKADLDRFGGRRLQLVKVSFEEPKKPTKGYRLLANPVITVQDETGSESSLRLLGAILEHDGKFQVATYFIPPVQR